MTLPNQCTVRVDSDVLRAAGPNPDLVGSIDQGTSSTRFLLFTREGRVAARAQVEFGQIFPPGADKVGWHEHDPLELWSSVRTVVSSLAFELRVSHSLDLAPSGPSPSPLRAVGIANQRETTIAWNARTGRPYHNAIVWDDTRTEGVAAATAGGDRDRLRDRTGLPIASYFAGTKVRWLLDHVKDLRDNLADEVERNNVRFGTVDAWLVYQLTGSALEGNGFATPPAGGGGGGYNVGGDFVTDPSNASRWLFLDLHTLEWDLDLVSQVCGSSHSVPLTALPEIRPSSGDFGCVSPSCGVPALSGVPIAAILGDQQSAMLGQCAFGAGEAKCTYGTGLFLMMGTGTEAVRSNHGLLTTVAYQLGPKLGRAGKSPPSSSVAPEVSGTEERDGVGAGEVCGGGGSGGSGGAGAGPVHYALEGSVSHSGSTIQWLRDRICILSDASESETLASKTESNDGLYLVPAFAGLFAPHWRPDARGCIVGITASHTRAHIARAALEACAYQAREVLECVRSDSGVELTELRVDGGGTANALLMQFQADVVDRDVVRPEVMETTARGAAFAAGLAVGVWSDLDELRALWTESRRWKAQMSEEVRERNWRGWARAVRRSFEWAITEEEEEEGKGGGEEEKLKVEPTVGGETTKGVWETKEKASGPNMLLMGAAATAAFVVGCALGSKSRR